MEELKEKLEIENITKIFVSAKGGEFEAIRDVPFDVRGSRFLALLRPGLCDETALLNILAGLEEVTSGTIRLGGQELRGYNDKISMIFQKLSLFSWKMAIEGVEVGLKYIDVSRKERREQAQKFIDLVGLTGFEGAYPGQLSNGMKQRVKTTRAYTADPEILILNEPLGQLDAQTWYSVEDEISCTWEQEKKMVIFMTNDIEEAVYLGDRITLLGKCPTSVKEICDIDLPRPQNMVDEAFSELWIRVSDDMELSV